MVGLAHGNAENQREFARRGAIEAVVSAMRNPKLLKNASFQEKACRSLAYLAANNMENQKAIAQAGGPEVVLRAKETHRDVENVQEWAVKCLGILASDATAILASMRCFKNNASVQQWGCNALGHLAHVTSNGCDDIVNLHGVDTILSAMKHHEKDVWISLAGCETIWMLVYQHSKYKQLVGRKGGVERVLKTMQNFLGHAPLQKWGCAALVRYVRARSARISILSLHSSRRYISTTTTTGKSVRGFGEYQDIDSRRRYSHDRTCNESTLE